MIYTNDILIHIGIINNKKYIYDLQISSIIIITFRVILTSTRYRNKQFKMCKQRCSAVHHKP